MICKRASQVMGFVLGSFGGQTGWPCSKHGSQRQKLLRSTWNWNWVKPNLFIPIWHSSVQNLPNGIDSWLEQPYVMATLRMSRRPGQIELKRCIHLTEGIGHFVTWMVANCWINWNLTVAKCAVPSGLSCLIAPKGILDWSFSCLSDTAFAYYTLTGNLSSST